MYYYILPEVCYVYSVYLFLCSRHVDDTLDMSSAAETLTPSGVRAYTHVGPTPASGLPGPIRYTEKHTVHWFRKGLRLHDNPALREGLLNASSFRCVFIIDPWFASSSNVGINKWRYFNNNIYYTNKFIALCINVCFKVTNERFFRLCECHYNLKYQIICIDCFGPKVDAKLMKLRLI